MVVLHAPIQGCLATYAVTISHALSKGLTVEAIGGDSKECRLPSANNREAGVGIVPHALCKSIRKQKVAKATPDNCLEGPTETLSCLAIQTAAVAHLWTMPQKSQQHCSKLSTFPAGVLSTVQMVMMARYILAYLCGL